MGTKPIHPTIPPIITDPNSTTLKNWIIPLIDQKKKDIHLEQNKILKNSSHHESSSSNSNINSKLKRKEQTLDHLRLKLEVLESKCPGILDLINQKVDRKIREFSKSQGNSN